MQTKAARNVFIQTVTDRPEESHYFKPQSLQRQKSTQKRGRASVRKYETPAIF